MEQIAVIQKLATVIDFQFKAFQKKKKQKNIGIIARCPKFYGKDFLSLGQYILTIAIGKNQKLTANFDYTIQNRNALENIKTKMTTGQFQLLKNDTIAS